MLRQKSNAYLLNQKTYFVSVRNISNFPRIAGMKLSGGDGCKGNEGSIAQYFLRETTLLCDQSRVCTEKSSVSS